MLQFAKSLFVVYATRNKRMPDFKCAIIVLVNKNKKKTAAAELPVFETCGIYGRGKKYQFLPARNSSCVIELIG